MNRLSRARARTLQTDRHQTDGRAIAYSEREREFTFAKIYKLVCARSNWPYSSIILILERPIITPKPHYFSEHKLAFTFAMLSPVRLPVCNARAPYSGGRNFPQYFHGIWYVGHPLTSNKKFMEIVPEEPLRRES